MALYPIKLPPGVFRNGTEYQSAGRWYDANLVRWFEGTMRPVGGWVKESNTQLTGVCRGLYAWKSNDYVRYAAIGTNAKLYAYGGGSFVDITPASYTVGRVDSVYQLGYGIAAYGTADYGVERPGLGLVLEAATWSIDNFGQYPVFCAPHDGRILYWDLNAANDAVVVDASAPTDCRGVVVTPERFLTALGADGDPRKVQWADQESLTVWSQTSSNQAGEFPLQTSGTIMGARRIRGGTLIWTDSDVHTMTYIGAPLVFGFERVGSFCGVAGPNAMAALDSFAVWMGTNGFFMYDGVVNPLPCDVQDYVFSNINKVQSAKIYAGANTAFGEVWWFYPSANSTENDRYVVYNYREKHWSIGSLSRTAWTGSGVFEYPLATSADGYLYDHESGWTADGTPLVATRYALAGPTEIGAGDNIIHAQQLIPDERTQGQTKITFKSRFTPEGTEQTYGPYTLTPYTDVRFTGRQVSLQINGNADADWRVGVVRVDGVAGGKR